MTTETAVAKPARSPTVGDRIRFVLRGIGQTLLTLGVVVMLFVVYEVWITTWVSERENHRLVEKLEQTWVLPDSGPQTIPVGDAMGILYIPRLGKDYAWGIVEGSRTPNDDELAKGPAHYGDTQLPGELGNFAVAGHRVGKGEPFLNLDHLKAGDPVIVETRKGWFVYRVKGANSNAKKDDADGLPGREIVSPGDGSSLLSVPHQPGARPTERLMTMTTCHPKFTAENRMIVYAKLDLTVPFEKGNSMPAPIRALYGGGA